MRLTTHLITLLFTLLMGITQAHAVTVSAQVDTHKVQEGDSLVLTVTVNEKAFGREPDVSHLKEQFRIINKVQSSSVRMINGQMESSMSWSYTLVPKVSGYVVIPPIKYGNQQTKPITIQVQKRTSQRTAKDLVFVEALVDKKEVYVQEQIILTLRLYRRTQLVDATWPPPKINDAVMESLTDARAYQTTIDRYTYHVTEYTFAVFPQKSGTLVIPESRLTATIGGGSRGGFFFDPFSSTGKPIQRKTERIEIKVNPIPDSYPNTHWLPSSSVGIVDHWTPQNTKFKVGEAVTRTIILQAKGLTATALPPLPTPQSDKFKVYPDKAETESNVDADGIISKRVESYAFIPTEAGTITLPEIQISWWDVTRDELKTATLPAKTIEVEGTATVQRTDQSVSAPPSVNTSTVSAPPSVGMGQSAQVSTTWQWLAIIGFTLWIITTVIAVWLGLKRKNGNSNPAEPTTVTTINLKDAKKRLKQACQENNPQQAKACLIDWGKAMFPQNRCYSLGDVASLVNSEKCQSAIKELEIVLYRSEEGGTWDGTYLWEALEDVEKAVAEGSDTSNLEPLYPAT